MGKFQDLMYLYVLTFSGLCVGIIIHDGNTVDYVLLGLLLVAELLYYTLLGKYPKWISPPIGNTTNNDEDLFRHEAWKRWIYNLSSRRFAFTLSILFSFIIGRILSEFFFSPANEQRYIPVSLLVAIAVISGIIVFLSIRWFVNNEKNLYYQRFWTKTYILEKIREAKEARE